MKINSLLKRKNISNKCINIRHKKVISNKTTESAVTLISLVITIVVVLILGGVSIATLTGENGILKQAGEANTKLKIAQIEEEIKLAYNAMQIDSYEKGWQIEERAEGLQKELRTLDSEATVEVIGEELEVIYKRYQTTISANGVIGEITEVNKIKFKIKGTPVKTVSVPANFVHVGGTIDEGYVISDNVADKGKGADSDELVGNQFVRVPVDKNQKIRVNVKKNEQIESIIITDPYGDEILNVSNVGTSYKNEEIEPTINGFYNLEVTTASGTEEKMLDVYSLYARRMWELDQYISEENAQLKGYNTALEYINAEVSPIGSPSTIEETIKLLKPVLKKKYSYYKEAEEIDHIRKVNENGGFFIARYEATYEDGKAASKKGTQKVRTTSSIELVNGMLWNFIDQEEALSKAKEYNTSLNSTLPTKSAWDRVICWLYETGGKTKTELIMDSTSWGNYKNDTFTSNGVHYIKPGEFEETKANNIYDLAGNVWERITESYSTNYMVTTGGYCDLYGFEYPVSSYRTYIPTHNSSNIGFRFILFM